MTRWDAMDLVLRISWERGLLFLNIESSHVLMVIKKSLVMFLIKCMLISYAAEDVCSCIVELDKKLYENKCFLFQYNDKKTSHFFFH